MHTLKWDTTIASWSSNQAKEYLLDQTAEAMRAVMLHDRKYSPLRQWGDAAWFYTWTPDRATCIILPYIEVAIDDIRDQRPTNYSWLQLPAPLESMPILAAKGQTHHIELPQAYVNSLMESGIMDQATTPTKKPS